MKFATLALLSALIALPSMAASSSEAAVPTIARHTVRVLKNGLLLTSGSNEYGQTGSMRSDAPAPEHRFALEDAQAVSTATGARHSLVLDNKGRVWAFGDNSSGQLGQSHTRPVTGPVQVRGLPLPAKMVSAGTQHSAALLSDGSVWVWGSNARGQAGNERIDAFIPVSSPAEVHGFKEATSLSSQGDQLFVVLSRASAARKKPKAKAESVLTWGAGIGTPQPIELSKVTKLPASAVALQVPASSLGSNTPTGKGDKTSHSAPGPKIPIISTSTARLSDTVAEPPVVRASTSPEAAPSIRLEPKNSPTSTPPQPVQTPTTAPPTLIKIAGTVRVANSLSGMANTAPALVGVQISAEGAHCTPSDDLGHFVCQVPLGWSGRLFLKKTNYRFIPSSMTYQDVRQSLNQQDFASIYELR